MPRELKRIVGTSTERSRIMRAVRRSNTMPEATLCSSLKRLGLSFEVNRRDLPGSPDIVFPRERLAVFVHGCFWHYHRGCHLATTPKSNVHYWRQKFTANQERDRRKMHELRKLGWRTLVVWQCQIEKSADEAGHVVKSVLELAQKNEPAGSIPLLT